MILKNDSKKNQLKEIFNFQTVTILETNVWIDFAYQSKMNSDMSHVLPPKISINDTVLGSSMVDVSLHPVHCKL